MLAWASVRECHQMNVSSDSAWRRQARAPELSAVKVICAKDELHEAESVYLLSGVSVRPDVRLERR